MHSPRLVMMACPAECCAYHTDPVAVPVQQICHTSDTGHCPLWSLCRTLPVRHDVHSVQTTVMCSGKRVHGLSVVCSRLKPKACVLALGALCAERHAW